MTSVPHQTQLSSAPAQTTPDNGSLRILIDGDCPLCVHEARMMSKLDKGHGRLSFVDIADPNFDASAYGKTHDDVMGSIHAVTPEGEILTGVEVFRRAYSALGLGWLINWTGWPLVKPIVDRLYIAFAKIRPRLPGRGCASGTCRVPGAPRSA